MAELDPTHFLGHWVLGMGLEGTGEAAEALPGASTGPRVVGRDARSR